MKFHFGTNWKMSKTNTQARQFVTELLPLLRGQDLSRHYLFVIPSFTAVPLVVMWSAETGLPLHVGAQNVHWEDGVEATGEISARILADIPVDLVEIGHSERRQKFGETDADINVKVRAAFAGSCRCFFVLARVVPTSSREWVWRCSQGKLRPRSPEYHGAISPKSCSPMNPLGRSVSLANLRILLVCVRSAHRD